MNMKMLNYIALCTVVLPLIMGTQFSVASEALDAKALLDRFRAVDWDRREIGQNKDLSDSAWKLRIEVENDLIALGESAVPTLIDACSDPNKHVRLLASYVLGCLNNRSAIPALMQMVKDDKYAAARLMAVEALGRLGAKEALEIVQAATEDSSPNVRSAAKWALPRVQKGEGVGDVLRKSSVSTFDRSKIATAVVGKPAPDFSLTDDAGETVRLSEFQGKKHVAIIFMLADW